MSAKLAIPTLLAVFALLFAFKTVGIGPSGGASAESVQAMGPTPYSADHARITTGDSEKEPVSTF